jgi:hypothetical protein
MPRWHIRELRDPVLTALQPLEHLQRKVPAILRMAHMLNMLVDGTLCVGDLKNRQWLLD